MKRNHNLFVGEVVFDVDNNYFGVIVELGNNYAKINMYGKVTDTNVPNLPNGWCEYENKIMFDYEITEKDLVWETNNLDMLYQIAWGIKDIRTNNIVCYEHNDIGEIYPYYSPYLEENLYTFEVYNV